jgi:hypothetical protein
LNIVGIFDNIKRKNEQEDIIEEIIARLGCDYLIIEENDVHGVMAKYHQAVIEGKKEGYTPLIIIPSELMVEMFDLSAENTNDDRESIIAKAKDINVKELLKRMLEDVMPMDEEEEVDFTGEFSIQEQTNQFLSIQEGMNEKVILAKIPTSKPWEVAAWVPMGGFNECPLPEEQIAIFKYWYEKYGAAPALVTHDVWELYVENPPNTQEEAESLAWEQYGFCSDIVWQGIGTVNGLAGTLIHSSVWYFWWD